MASPHDGGLLRAKWYKRKVVSATDSDELRVALKKFFQFLAAEKGIHNAKVLDSLR